MASSLEQMFMCRRAVLGGWIGYDLLWGTLWSSYVNGEWKMCSSFVTILSRAAVMAFPIRCRLFCSEAALNRQMIKRHSVLNKRDDLQWLMKVNRYCHQFQIKNEKWNIYTFGGTPSEKAAMNSSVGYRKYRRYKEFFGAKWNDSINTHKEKSKYIL
jgi:hypothetical protein